MTDFSVFVGLYVHKETNVVAIAEAGRAGEVRHCGEIANTPASLDKPIRKLRCGMLLFTTSTKQALMASQGADGGA